MYKFNPSEWKNKIKDPLWYLEVPQVMKELIVLRNDDIQTYEIQKEIIYDFFEEEISLGNVCLGDTGVNFDKQRKPIDTIVIHHTSNPPGMTNDRLSAIELARLYAPQYAGKGPSYEANKEIKGTPIYSGHSYNCYSFKYIKFWIYCDYR